MKTQAALAARFRICSIAVLEQVLFLEQQIIANILAESMDFRLNLENSVMMGIILMRMDVLPFVPKKKGTFALEGKAKFPTALLMMLQILWEEMLQIPWGEIKHLFRTQISTQI